MYAVQYDVIHVRSTQYALLNKTVRNANIVRTTDRN